MENSDVCIGKAIYKFSTFNNKIATYISFGDNYVTKVDPSFCYEDDNTVVIWKQITH